MAADETKQTPVPPGWVRLAMRDGREYLCPSTGTLLMGDGRGGSFVWHVGEDSENAVVVVESPAEVAALIDAAQRAKRRADALPVMAAIMGAARGMLCASEVAAEILDAIEAREAGR